MAFVFLASVALVDATPVSAVDWTQQINATRSSQLYYESIMRSADGQIPSLKRARKQTQRKLKGAKRNVGRTKARRAKLKARYADSRKRYTSARRDLKAAEATPPAPDPAGAILVLSTLLPVDTIEAPGPAAQALLTESAATLEVTPEVTAKDVAKLKKQMKKHKRAAKKASRKARRVARNVRTRARSLASIKRQGRAAIARRESAERALAGRIIAMSHLAQRRIAKKTNVRPGTGFAWPTRGRVTQGYGCTGGSYNPPRGSCRHFHDGLDISGYRGAPIRAAAVGVVSYIGWNPWDQDRRAFIIVVAHTGGYETLYGHVLPSRRVRVGQVVKRGAVIGYMGSTGRSTGVHLHLEMRRGNTTLNPLGFL